MTKDGKKHGFWKNRVTKQMYASIEDEKTPVPRLPIRFADSRTIILTGLFIVLLFFGVGGVWVTYAQIEGAVIASGELRVDTERKTVQHLEGGIVREILVRNGDIVEPGQPLILLDSTRIVAKSEQLILQIVGAHLKSARLEAQMSLRKKIEWPSNKYNIDPEIFADLLSSTEKVFKAGREALISNVVLLQKQIDQLQEQDKGLVGRIAAEDSVIESLQEELEAKMTLFEDQYIDKSTIFTLRRSIAERQGSKAQLAGSRAELGEKIAEIQLRITNIRSEYRQSAINQQAEVQQKMFDFQQQLLPLTDARQRLTVVAPVRGEVVALRVHSKGGVISPGQPLMDIVPENSKLIVECNIQVKDINHVHKGQKADIQLLAFNQRTTPKISGKIIYISADRIMESTTYGDIPTYLVHVEISKKELRENHLEITPGMPASVFIRTDPRTVLEYLIEPIVANFDRALREN